MTLHRPFHRLTVLLFSLGLFACSSTGGQKVTQKPAGPDLKQASDINVQLGVGYIKRQQYQAAKNKLEKAIDQNPENLLAYKNLAYLYARLGLLDESREKYEEALELKPDDADTLNSYGAFLCSIGELQEAQEKFARAYNDPFYDSIYMAQSNAGSCYIKQGEYEKAETLLRASLRKHPKLTGSLLSMAEIGIETGRYFMARAYIERYHSLQKPSAESLWLQIQAEKALGADDYYRKYARQLLNEFPDSKEAGLLEALRRDEQRR